MIACSRVLQFKSFGSGLVSESTKCSWDPGGRGSHSDRSPFCSIREIGTPRVQVAGNELIVDDMGFVAPMTGEDQMNAVQNLSLVDEIPSKLFQGGGTSRLDSGVLDLCADSQSISSCVRSTWSQTERSSECQTGQHGLREEDLVPRVLKRSKKSRLIRPKKR